MAVAQAAAAPTGYESTRIQLTRRMTSWAQLREAHTGHSFWFNTILISSNDLEAAFEPSKVRIRTTRLAILGMSLSAILDISTPKDFLKNLQMLVQEFDNVQDDKFDKRGRGGVLRAAVGVGVNMARSTKRNTLVGSSELSVGLQEGDASYLMTPNIPYDLDYFQVAITACDLVLTAYDRILSFLSPTSQANQGTFPAPPASASAYSTFERVTGALGPASLDSIQKIDAKLTKTLTAMTKDFDALARKLVKNEIDLLSGAGLVSAVV